MKKNKLYIVFIFIFLSMISFAASYGISSLSIVANLKEDGSMDVKESVIYEIDEINGVYFDIDAKNFGELTALEIYEDTGTKTSGKYSYRKVSPSKYEVSLNDDLYRIKLYSKNRNNIRNFVFAYTLSDAVKVYNDVAQFNRKMVGQNWQQGIDAIQVKITVPVNQKYDNSKILAFGHGPLSGYLDKIDNSVVYSLENYYPGDFVEAHILMEPEIFSKLNKNKIINRNMKQELLDMEARLSEEANAQREKAQKREEFLNKIQKYDKAIFGTEAGLWGLLMYYIHRIFKKKNKYRDFFGKYLRDIPEDASPSLAGTIMSGDPNNEEILATLLDLIRRKIVDLDDSSGKNKLTLLKDIDELDEQEKTIIDIYFNDFGDGKSVILEEIKASSSMAVARKFEKWQYQIYREMDRKRFFYEGLGFLKGAPLFLIGAAFFAGAIFQIAIFENPIFMALTFMGFILIASTLGAKRPADNLQKEKAKWQALKNFLGDYSLLEDAKINSIRLWEQYFVYAVALGVSEKVVKAYKKALQMGQITDIPTSRVGNGAYSSYRTLSLMDAYSRGNFNRSINNVTKATYNRSMADISKSRRSSSSGRGGGFGSGSSSGGGSRGGGGAF